MSKKPGERLRQDGVRMFAFVIREDPMSLDRCYGLVAFGLWGFTAFQVSGIRGSDHVPRKAADLLRREGEFSRKEPILLLSVVKRILHIL